MEILSTVGLQSMKCLQYSNPPVWANILWKFAYLSPFKAAGAVIIAVLHSYIAQFSSLNPANGVISLKSSMKVCIILSGRVEKSADSLFIAINS